MDKRNGYIFDGVENTEKRRKCRLQVFYLFYTICSKGLFPRVVKTQDCVVKG